MRAVRGMRLLENELYLSDLRRVCGLALPWQELNGKRILISGATGMIGSTLIDVLMMRNRDMDVAGNSAVLRRNSKTGAADYAALDCGAADCAATDATPGCRIIALGRSEEKAKERFREYWEDPHFTFVKCNINDRENLTRAFGAALGGKALPADGSDGGAVDYVFHAASNTHPVAYANDPIGTVVTNIIGLDNLLHVAAEHGCSRFLFASSNEIYGENRGDTELFDEKYCGYIDCNTMRAGYPESKRAGEALCQAYIRQKGLDVVIPRFTRSFGPTLLRTDTKALSQFIRKGVAGENIVLKSAGTQFFSYTYVCDAVSGLLYCLLKGKCGEAYNIADVSCDITLRDLAKAIADYVGTEVIFDLPDEVEAAGYSKATKARLDSTKLQGLGWKAQFDMKTALAHTIEVMRQVSEKTAQKSLT